MARQRGMSFLANCLSIHPQSSTHPPPILHPPPPSSSPTYPDLHTLLPNLSKKNLFVKPKAETKIIWVMLRREKDY